MYHLPPELSSELVFWHTTCHLRVNGTRFEEFTIPSLADLVDGDKKPLRNLLAGQQFRPAFSSLRLKGRNTILFWIRSVIALAYESATDEDCREGKAKAHKARKIGIPLLFRKICAVQQVVKTGMWSSQTEHLAFYLRDVIHRCMGTFSIGPVAAAQQAL